MPAHVFNGQFLVVLIAENRFMFRAVVLEKPVDFRHARAKINIRDKNRNAHDALYEGAPRRDGRARRIVADQVEDNGRQKEEQPHREQKAQHGTRDHNHVHHFIAEGLFHPFVKFGRLLVLFQSCLVNGIGKRFVAHGQRIDKARDPAQQRQAHNGIFILYKGGTHFLCGDGSVAHAHGDLGLLWAAHQNSLYQRLSPDGRDAFCLFSSHYFRNSFLRSEFRRTEADFPTAAGSVSES